MSKKLSEKDEKFAYNYLSDREAYHHHKERMAYIGFLVQTAFFTAIMTFNWESSSLETSNIALKSTLALAVLFLLLIHVFLRWQLRLRRYAALQVATLTNALLENLKGSVEGKNSECKSPKAENATNRNESKLRKWWTCFLLLPCKLFQCKRWVSLVDRFFWPCPSVLPYADIAVSEYPDWYQHEFNYRVAKGTGAFTGEYLVTLGSWFILAATVVRFTVLSCV